jgi:hypothetical protein
MVAGFGLLVLVATARAENAATFPSGGIVEALKARKDMTVTLHLDAGTTIGGTVVEVRDHTVVLRAVTTREYSDALVALDHVIAVEVRR